MKEQYKFQFNANNTSVLSKFEVERHGAKLQKTAGSTFDVQTGVNDAGLNGVVAVTETALKKGFVETVVYADQDGDGLFRETFEIEVATVTAPAAKLEKHKFSFDQAGKVVAEAELSKGMWKAERIDINETFAKVKLGGVDYLLKTETERGGIEFELFRDDNGDGVWTQIAEGEAAASALDPATGTLNLVGLQSYLAASAGIIG